MGRTLVIAIFSYILSVQRAQEEPLWDRGLLPTYVGHKMSQA